MSIIQRVNKIQNLDQLIVDIEDTSENSPNFFSVFGLPAEFPSGKTAFLINGSDSLVINSEVRVEILDSDRNVIYSQPIQFLEGISRLISVFVYPDNSFGEATLTLVGEVFRLPESFQRFRQESGNPLVRWQKKILINPSLENTSKIRFFRDPKITVSEVLRPYLIRTFGGGTSTDELTDGTISGQVAANEFVLTSKGFDFRGQMVGATVFVSDPIISDPTVNTIPYTTSITEVKNSKVAIAEFSYQIQTDEQKALQTIEQKVFQFPAPNTFDFLDSAYTMSILTEPTFSSTQNIRSFAKVRVANMTPFSGDVNLVKLYMKSEGSVGDFELIADQVLESIELLVDTASIKFNTPTGYFFTQSSIDSFWSASQNDLTIPTASLIYRNEKIIDSMLISGSDERLPLGSFYKVENTLPIVFDEGAEYTFEAQFHAVKKQAQELLSPNRTFSKNNKVLDVNFAKLQIYMSGSAFAPNPPGKREIGEKSEFGKLIQEIELASNSIPTEKTVGIVETNFTANRDGDGTVIFIVEAGDWHIHNITIKLGQETGFSPDLTTFFIPLPDWEKNDPIKFKAEFYDINNNRSITFVTSSEFTFEGGNSYIGGVNNLLTGSLFLGGVTGSGIEMAGVESAFIRTVGYLGFVSASNFSPPAPGGFMLWSGSVTLGGITDEYAAVGLEIHGGSGSAINPTTGIGETHALRFRTDTGVLEITGAIQATFISASAGEIGGFTITGDALAGTNFLLSGSAINNEFFISSSNFNVKANGSMTASSALISGSNVRIEVSDFELSAGNGALQISAAQTSMSVGLNSGNRVIIVGQTDPFISIAQLDSAIAFASGGIFIGARNESPEFSVVSRADASQFLKFNGAILTWKATNSELDAQGNFTASGALISGSNVKIDVEDFKLTAGGGILIIDSANELISLGTTANKKILIQGNATNPNISIAQVVPGFNNDGFFAGQSSGNTRFSVKQGAEFLRWDGSILEIKAANFELDNSGNIIASNVILSGNISASAGNIGGWTIEDGVLRSALSGQSMKLDASQNNMHFSASNGDNILIDDSFGFGPSIRIQTIGETNPAFFSAQFIRVAQDVNIINLDADDNNNNSSLRLNRFGSIAEIVKVSGSGDGDFEFINAGNTGIIISISGEVLMPSLDTTAGGFSDLRINATGGELLRDTSSKRYKKNIKNIEIDTKKLYNLRPVSFNSTHKQDEGGRRYFGLIAEEVYEEIPQLVVLDNDGLPESVNYAYLSVLLLNELKSVADRLQIIEEKLGL